MNPRQEHVFCNLALIPHKLINPTLIGSGTHVRILAGVGNAHTSQNPYKQKITS
jgi:hypothetical protein